ncbi:MAG: hypothetical protein IBX39_09105 [Candidatus Methanoperedenaceae archaeon]|nr:hypothetical protein [Candidatus Methanoperedenaceae archaeon]
MTAFKSVTGLKVTSVEPTEEERTAKQEEMLAKHASAVAAGRAPAEPEAKRAARRRRQPK